MQRQAITPPYALPAFLEQLCRDLRQHEAARQQRDYAEAARFNPLRFLDSRENGLSRILAFLLDPQESHAQGGLFLDAFLKAADLHRFLAYDSVEVGTEKVLKNSRRKHDIRILGRLKGKTVWAVSIENKLCGAPDREGQVGSYLADLKEYADDYCLIYLPPFECVPDAASVDPEELEQHRIGGTVSKFLSPNLWPSGWKTLRPTPAESTTSMPISPDTSRRTSWDRKLPHPNCPTTLPPAPNTCNRLCI
ncbi:PD-(D/E)XK nuclease family protein [Kingella potus]|uniref:PD-(D/E)XK nuclease family protein n=1 Tax=Kingella potus TaxID=265175 RepID=UPI001FD172B9|nr:PD-(D/E)XK nuclease family protein [Kingella potus]UOP00718.1 PD-(D/E)XK nuclease family protein [Kingella potus]